jgi:DeoR family fructose operon transcriptional repressor
MRAAERQLKIQESLDAGEFVDVSQLGRRFGASPSTIRRDLMRLERRGLLQRVHGGAVSAQAREDRLDFALRSVRARKEKARIGKAAAVLVEDGQTVILDGGSTVAEVARNLVGRRIQIITSSLPIAEIFWDSRTTEVTLTGGYLYPRLGVLLGPFCEQTLGSLSADLLIMGIGGITETGFSNSNTLIVGSERRMIAASRTVMVVADHAKFGRRAMVDLAPLDVADAVVSNQELEPRYVELLEDAGVRVILA